MSATLLNEYGMVWYGMRLTENARSDIHAGHEIDGPCAGHENAGHDNTGHEFARQDKYHMKID